MLTETQHASSPLFLSLLRLRLEEKKKAEDVSDVKLLEFAADGVDAC